jgi:two-component system sensor histidine kinase NreB
VLDQLGPEAAIRALADRLERHGIEVDLDIALAYGEGRHGLRHDAELETSMYRIVQEALTNARKHGGARRAIVEVVEDENQIQITVRDDGQGFDVNANTEGFGLLGMRERAELMGGTLHVESAPGSGTTIVATLPAHRRPDPSLARTAGD